MCNLIPVIFYALIVLRLISLLISAVHEKKLKAEGAVEFGSRNTTYLITAHFIYYACCMLEGLYSSAFSCDDTSVIGGSILLFSMLVLLFVIVTLGKSWTVKLIVAKPVSHTVSGNQLFKTIKQLNYYLNVIPEMLGLAIFMHATYSLLIAFPIYLVPLIIRIRQQNCVLNGHCAAD